MKITTWVNRVLEEVKHVVIVADDYANSYHANIYYNDGSNETLELTDIHEIINS